jgi:hypothetical protein
VFDTNTLGVMAFNAADVEELHALAAIFHCDTLRLLTGMARSRADNAVPLRRHL